MRTRRQNIQLELALEPVAKGEARNPDTQGTEARTAHAEPERPAAGQQPLMEAVVEPGNLKKALARVRRNRGAPGVDGMTVDELGDHLKVHWPEIRSRLARRQLHAAAGTAGGDTEGVGRRSPARRATVLDRFIQQAVMQVLRGSGTPLASYGFRPGRSAHQAIRRARTHPRGQPRPRPGEVLRGQSRHPAGAKRVATNAWAHPRLTAGADGGLRPDARGRQG